MKRGDVPGVYEIERECFMSEAWAIEDFYALTEDLPYCAALVAEEDGKPVGYIAMSFAADEADIASVAVSGEYRRQGIACALTSALERDGEAGEGVLGGQGVEHRRAGAL